MNYTPFRELRFVGGLKSVGIVPHRCRMLRGNPLFSHRLPVSCVGRFSILDHRRLFSKGAHIDRKSEGLNRSTSVGKPDPVAAALADAHYGDVLSLLRLIPVVQAGERNAPTHACPMPKPPKDSTAERHQHTTSHLPPERNIYPTTHKTGIDGSQQN